MMMIIMVSVLYVQSRAMMMMVMIVSVCAVDWSSQLS